MSNRGKRGSLSYVFTYPEESERRNFTMFCTCCGKIFEPAHNSLASAERMRKEFKFCYDCGAQFGGDDD